MFVYYDNVSFIYHTFRIFKNVCSKICPVLFPGTFQNISNLGQMYQKDFPEYFPRYTDLSFYWNKLNIDMVSFGLLRIDPEFAFTWNFPNSCFHTRVFKFILSNIEFSMCLIFERWISLTQKDQLSWVWRTDFYPYSNIMFTETMETVEM